MALLKILIYTYMYLSEGNGDFELKRGRIDRIEVRNIAKQIGDGNVSMSKFNKTSIELSVYIELYQDAPIDLMIDLQLYAEFSNEYQRMPYNFKNYKLCDALGDVHEFIESQIDKYGYFPSSCPIKKSIYSIKNFVLQDKVLPNFPWHKVMYEINLTSHSIVMVTIRCYVEIDHDTDMINKALGIL